MRDVADPWQVRPNVAQRQLGHIDWFVLFATTNLSTMMQHKTGFNEAAVLANDVLTRYGELKDVVFVTFQEIQDDEVCERLAT